MCKCNVNRNLRIRTLERIPITCDRNAGSISLFRRIFLSSRCSYLLGESSGGGKRDR